MGGQAPRAPLRQPLARDACPPTALAPNSAAGGAAGGARGGSDAAMGNLRVGLSRRGRFSFFFFFRHQIFDAESH